MVFPVRNARQYTKKGRLGPEPADGYSRQNTWIGSALGENERFLSFAGPAIYWKSWQNPSELPPTGQIPRGATAPNPRWAAILA